MAQPLEERAPLIHWMAERRRQKDSRHLMVQLYGWSLFSARRDARRLQTVVASWAMPPEAEKIKGVKDACSVFVVASRERDAAVGMSMTIEDSDVEESALISSSPEAIGCNVQASTLLNVRGGSGEGVTSDRL